MITEATASVQQELDDIRKRHRGLLHPEDVVEFAKGRSTALHDKFEWNNGKAGHAFRLWQARHLIKVFVTVHEETGNKIPVFVSLTTDRVNGGGYRTIQDICAIPALYERMLDDALAEAGRFQEKYENLKELKPVFKAIAAVKKKRKR